MSFLVGCLGRRPTISVRIVNCGRRSKIRILSFFALSPCNHVLTSILLPAIDFSVQNDILSSACDNPTVSGR